MPKYQATVHVTGLTGENPRAVRSALDELLRKSGLENCRVVAVDVEGVPNPNATRPATPVPNPSEMTWRREANIGGLLLIAAAAWAIWFFWWMLSSGPG
jgi:hypothetical protein